MIRLLVRMLYDYCNFTTSSATNIVTKLFGEVLDDALVSQKSRVAEKG